MSGVSHSRRIIALLLTLLVTAALAACGTVQPAGPSGDRLRGSIVLALPKAEGTGAGPQVRVPDTLAGIVDATPYTENNNVGTRLDYRDLSFGQFNLLGTLIGQALPGADVKLTAKRSGTVVSVHGAANLKQVTGAYQLVFSVEFPDVIAATDGERQGEKGTLWRLKVGDTTPMGAESHYADPNTATLGGWSLVMGCLTLAAVAIVGAAAWVARTRDPRPGRPA